MKPVKIKELSRVKMVCGNEKKYSTVIEGGSVKEWVGIGWIKIRKATKEDKRRFATAS